MKNNYVTQIRMSDNLHDRVMRISDETGESMNGTMLHLIALGLKVYESQISVMTATVPERT